MLIEISKPNKGLNVFNRIEILLIIDCVNFVRVYLESIAGKDYTKILNLCNAKVILTNIKV